MKRLLLLLLTACGQDYPGHLTVDGGCKTGQVFMTVKVYHGCYICPPTGCACGLLNHKVCLGGWCEWPYQGNENGVCE